MPIQKRGSEIKEPVIKAIFGYDAEDEGELSFQPNDIIENIEDVDDDNGWWSGKNRRTGQVGFFPINYTYGWENILKMHKKEMGATLKRMASISMASQRSGISAMSAMSDME